MSQPMIPILLVLIVLAIFMFGVLPNLVKRNEKNADARVMRDLRTKALQLTPDALDLHAGPDEPFSIVMDLGFPAATASLMTTLTGDASIYFSSGGGVLGGIGHESVRQAAIAFVREAGRYVDRLAPTSEFPYPESGRVRFYVRTQDGVLAAEAGMEELGGSHPLSPLYHSGQNVITQLRLVSQGQGTP